MTVVDQGSRTGEQRELVSPLGSPDMQGRPIVEVMTLEQFQKGIRRRRGRSRFLSLTKPIRR